MMKKLMMIISLLTLIGFSGCEQINPPATGVSGTNVQVTQGGPTTGDENNDDDNDGEDDNDN